MKAKQDRQGFVAGNSAFATAISAALVCMALVGGCTETARDEDGPQGGAIATPSPTPGQPAAATTPTPPEPEQTPSESESVAAEGRWEVIPPAPIEGRSLGLGVWTGEELVVLGGELAGRETPLTGAAWSPAGGWRPIADAPLAFEAPFWFAVWAGSEVVVLPNEPSGPIGAQGAADPASDSWRTVAPLPIPEEGFLAVGGRPVWSGSHVLLTVGLAQQPGGQEATLQVASYDPTGDEWEFSEPGTVQFRYNRAVWTGAELVAGPGLTALGGIPGDPLPTIRDGAAFEPVTGSWRALPVAPPGFVPYFQGWEGTEVVLAGGQIVCPDCGLPNPPGGAAYDPEGDSWRRLEDVPDAVTVSDGLWTGAEMLMLPVPQEDTTLAAVRYDPATGMTHAMAPPPDPERSYQTMVWADDRLLVWGGVTDPPVRRPTTTTASSGSPPPTEPRLAGQRVREA